MECNRESQQLLIAQQLDHDRRMRTNDRLHDLIAQGTKGLAVLNAGAVVAMLAFVQALLGNAIYPAFKYYALTALWCFILGAFLATIVFFFHYTYINHASQDSGRRKHWRIAVWGLLIVSAACALVGGIIVTVGIGKAI